MTNNKTFLCSGKIEPAVFREGNIQRRHTRISPEGVDQSWKVVR